MTRYGDTKKAVHEAAEILETLAGKKHHEYFVAAAPVEHGEHRVPGTLIGDEYAVHCIHCGAYGASAKTVEWAVALWNQRPGEPLKL